MTVAGLLLAAGAGSRLGTPKALVELDGEPLLRRGIRVLRDGGCDPVLVVLGAAVVEIADAEVVVAEDWAEGLSASLRAGLAALPATVDAVVVALVDQPQVGSGAVRRLVAATGGDAAVATYAGEPRNPVLLRRAAWAEVAAAAIGDSGARGWLRAHPDRVVHVPCDGTGSADDVDTPDDLARASGPRTSPPTSTEHGSR